MAIDEDSNKGGCPAFICQSDRWATSGYMDIIQGRLMWRSDIDVGRKLSEIQDV